MKTKKIKIPIYYGALTIIISPTENYKEVAKEFGFETDFDLDMIGAFTESRIDKDGHLELFVCVDQEVENHLIAHECVHLTNAVFLHIGHETNRQNDEPQAYLTAWFFKEIEKFLNKK